MRLYPISIWACSCPVTLWVNHRKHTQKVFSFTAKHKKNNIFFQDSAILNREKWKMKKKTTF